MDEQALPDRRFERESETRAATSAEMFAMLRPGETEFAAAAEAQREDSDGSGSGSDSDDDATQALLADEPARAVHVLGRKRKHADAAAITTPAATAASMPAAPKRRRPVGARPALPAQTRGGTLRDAIDAVVRLAREMFGAVEGSISIGITRENASTAFHLTAPPPSPRGAVRRLHFEDA
jgi:hypothetical protein